MSEYSDPDDYDGPPLPDEPEDYGREVKALSDAIKPILANHHPLVQSGALAELLSCWLAGIWPPEARAELYKQHLALANDLVPESEKELFGELGHPAGRKDPQ